MSALSIQPPYPIFTDIDGQPLENGFVWIGTVNLDPQVNPIAVYWDAALTIPAVQPIRTLAGYPANSGTPARLYAGSDYSIRVMNKNGSVVYNAPAATERYSDVVVSSVNAQNVVYDPPFTGSVVTNVEAKLAQIVSVKDFGAVGDGVKNDSAAIQAALNASKAVFIPDGTYLINGPYTSAAGMEMQDGQVIIGESANAVLLQGTIRYMLTAGTNDGGTSNPEDNKKNIRISNLTLRNNAGTFLEQKHLLLLSAVSNVIVEKCNFIGFQGDAIYLGQGTSGTAERHNINVTIRDCFFDGVNNENRNGVSIVDGNGVIVDNCKFINCSRSDMPGPIDFEPNDALHNPVGRNLTVTNCEFFSCNGAGAFIYYTPYFVMSSSPSNVKFNNNYVDSACAFAAPVFFNTGETITDDSPLMGFEIVGNMFDGCSGATITATGLRGLVIKNNTFENTKGPVVIGNSNASADGLVYDVEFSGNTLRNSGNVTGMLQVGMVRRLNIVGNIFSKPRTSAYAITFYGNGVTTTSSYVTIERNQFIKNTLTPQTKTVDASSHTFLDPNTNRWFDNVADATLFNSFSFSYEETRFTAFYQNAASGSVLSVLPDSYPVGQQWNIVNGDSAAPDTYKQGIVETRKYEANTAYRKFIVQTYYPANNTATELKDMYWRKGASGSNTWSSWVKVTGV